MTTSTKQYYECHVTMQGDPAFIRPHVEALKWKFSAIDGDPSLGDGIKCYATRHYNAKLAAAHVLFLLYWTAGLLRRRGIKVLRRKVELVIHDDRAATVRCDGACPECHVDDLPDAGKGPRITKPPVDVHEYVRKCGIQ